MVDHKEDQEMRAEPDAGNTEIVYEGDIGVKELTIEVLENAGFKTTYTPKTEKDFLGQYTEIPEVEKIIGGNVCEGLKAWIYKAIYAGAITNYEDLRSKMRFVAVPCHISDDDAPTFNPDVTQNFPVNVAILCLWGNTWHFVCGWNPERKWFAQVRFFEDNTGTGMMSIEHGLIVNVKDRVPTSDYWWMIYTHAFQFTIRWQKNNRFVLSKAQAEMVKAFVTKCCKQNDDSKAILMNIEVAREKDRLLEPTSFETGSTGFRPRAVASEDASNKPQRPRFGTRKS